MFKTYEPSYSMLYMGNHSTVQVKGKGKIDLVFTSGNTLTLNDVLHVLDVHNLSSNLISSSSPKVESSLAKAITPHARLGHVYFKRMRNMANANLIPKLDSKNDKCQTCMHTKITRLPFPTIQRSSKILELVHSDVCDLHATPTIGGKKYFATFIDDYSRYCYVYLLHSKDKVLEKFRIYKNEVELKCDTRIKCLWTDRGGEHYDPRYFQSTRTVHQVTAPYTPQQNGIAERKNRTLMDMVNSMISHSGLSSGYWGEALLTACYILNRVPSKRSIKTPYELWNQRTPKLDYLQIWGCRAIVRLPNLKKRKLGAKGIECIFLGYAQNSKAYKFIVVEPNDLISINTIIESRDARFDENRFKTIPKAHEISKETIPITTEGNNDDSFSDHQQVEPRKSTR
ncbi:zinc finger, CCHC-type containing protein [Tanacetum coccineum]